MAYNYRTESALHKLESVYNFLIEAVQQFFSFFVVSGEAQDITAATAAAKFQIISVAVYTLFPDFVDAFRNHRFKVFVCPNRQMLQVFKERIHFLFKECINTGVIITDRKSTRLN